MSTTRICCDTSSQVYTASQIHTTFFCSDSKCIENEINTASHMFKDACKDIERRQMTRAVVTVVAPLHTQHCIVHRTIWNLSSPIRMVDVYCQHVANDLGLGSMNGHVFGREMKKEVQRLRDNMNDATLVDTSAQGIILQDATIGDGKNRNTRRWPVIVKAEVAHAMKQALQRCPFGEEDAVLEQLQLTNPDTVNHEIRHADMEDVVVG